MIRNQKQISRRPELIVRIGEHPRIDVAVRADERRIRHHLVKARRRLELFRLRIEESIG